MRESQCVVKKHFLLARLYSSFRDQHFDRPRSANAAETGWIKRTWKKWDKRERKERDVARISTRDVSDVIVRRKIYPAFIFDPSDALHFPLLSSASRVPLFIPEGSLEPPSTLATPVGMQSFGMP